MLNVYDTEPAVTEAIRGLIDTITVLDRYTVQVTLTSFDMTWQYFLGWSVLVVFAPEAYQAGMEDWRNAIGTGAFQVADYVSGSGVWYDRNPDYWIRDHPIGDQTYQLPFADQFVYAIIPDEATQLAALRTGKADAMFSVPWESRASLERTSPDLNQWEFDNWGSFMIGMRNDTAPYDDLRVRQALAAAIDMQTIIDNVFGASGVMLNQPFPAVWPETFYTPLDQLNADTQRAYSYDPDWARALLAEAGYPDGFETEIILPPSGRAVDLFSLIASYWAEIGVTLELQPTDEATIRNLERTRGHTHMISYEGSSPHPGEAIWASWVSDGEANLSIVNDPYIDETYVEATGSTDPAEQARLFKELGQYAAEGMNYIVLPGENGTTYAWPWIKNYAGEIHARRLNGGDAFKYAWVDQQLKESMGF